MAILDRLKGAADAAREKLKETFGEPKPDDDREDVELTPALDVGSAYALLQLGEAATLAEVRDAYRGKAKAALATGADGDRLLEALELLEEHLVPLAAAAAQTAPTKPGRKRATPRK
jgi:hypothetical protein